ncbi:hypothetical protein [Porcipelethomonas sp.]|uniref:hypothetical protein n=1 Tax=Porcipelethomonas sp. TaxID=2981675 RepID=UPI003EF5437F
MEKNKLELHCAKSLSAKEANTIRAIVPDDTLAELKELSRCTGIAMSQLARMLIEYALPFVEVIE